MNLVEELKWRGLFHDSTAGAEKYLKENKVSTYVGFDPTADSLHIGNLAPIMLLVHFQRHGHRPLILVGGATGRVGDPSGKTAERQLLDLKTLESNIAGQREQLERFLNFEGENAAKIVNNYEWFKDWYFLDFIRDVGKHITISYMMAKDSVQNRMESGMSFTEFSYQLIQGYDFLHLYQNEDCKFQMGGSDQWGNITTGTELIRRKAQGEAYALTCHLITKSDGTKFGKSEGGNVWLDPEKTSPYSFYQYWLNTTDEDAERYIKTFTLLEKEEIEGLIDQHKEAPHLRILQKKLAETVTEWIHGSEELQNAINASQILFGKATEDALRKLSQKDFDAVFEGVPKVSLSKKIFQEELPVIDFLSEKTGFLKSKGEARRALKENSISVNKTKIKEDYSIGDKDLLNEQHILLQKGKKSYFIVEFTD